jgi:hypothetical protein
MSLTPDPELVAFGLTKPPSTAAPARMADWLERKADLYDRLADETRDEVDACLAREMAWNARWDAQIQRRIAQSDTTQGLPRAGGAVSAT